MWQYNQQQYIMWQYNREQYIMWQCSRNYAAMAAAPSPGSSSSSWQHGTHPWDLVTLQPVTR
jgi:hypothetical protein